LSVINIFDLTTTLYPSIFAPYDMEPACPPEPLLRRSIPLTEITEHLERVNLSNQRSELLESFKKYLPLLGD
jgi:hypothetical protein